MTVNHDVVGSSPTGGVLKRSKERFFVSSIFLSNFYELFFIYSYFFRLFEVRLALNFYYTGLITFLISLSDRLVLSIRKVFHMLQKYYDHCFIFLKQIEEEYALLFHSNDDWESFHLKFLLYYLVRFRIKDEKDFIFCHFRAAYRLYLNHLLGNNLNFCY